MKESVCKVEMVSGVRLQNVMFNRNIYYMKLVLCGLPLTNNREDSVRGNVTLHKEVFERRVNRRNTANKAG